VLRGVGGEATRRLPQLPCARGAAAGHARVVPRDRDVDEALEEIALRAIARAPGLLESLVSREEVAALDQLEATLVGFGDVFARHAGNRSGA
jgi:hypothetical protein